MKIIYIGEWEVSASIDSDRHLTLSSKHTSGQLPFDVGEDLGDDQEFMIRLAIDDVPKKEESA